MDSRLVPGNNAPPQHAVPGTGSTPFFSSPDHQPFFLGEEPAGALLIHGFPGTPAEMRPAGRWLAANGWSAQGPLLPGLGPDIARLGQVHPDDWLSAVREPWREMGKRYPRRLLVGFSMGAALALHLAADDPPDALVLLAPFWQINTWLGKLLPVARYLLPQLRPFAKADFSDPALRAQIHDISPSADLDAPDVQQQLREQFVIRTALLDNIRRLGKNAYKLAGDIARPTLILQGADDTVINPQDTRQLVSRLPGMVTYHEFAGDHQFFKQDGDLTGRWLKTFLQSEALVRQTT